MLKAVIFDFDGVIADSEPLHYKAINAIVSRYDVSIPKDEYWGKYLGFNDVDCFKAISDDLQLGLDEQTIGGLVEEKFVIFEKFAKEESSIYDGVAGFIGKLRSNDIRVAICSGALLADIELMLEGSSLSDSFEVIVAADTEGLGKGKPFPDGYLLTLEKLNEMGDGSIEPKNCIVIEDSHWGLEAAAAAGMARVAVTNTYPADELVDCADRVLARLGESSMNELEGLCTA